MCLIKRVLLQKLDLASNGALSLPAIAPVFYTVQHCVAWAQKRRFSNLPGETLLEHV
jgi:hypothetical protein